MVRPSLRKLWRVETARARQEETQAFDREQLCFEVHAECEVARIQNCATVLEHSGALQRHKFEQEVAAAELERSNMRTELCYAHAAAAALT